MPAHIHLRFSHPPGKPTAAEFASLLDDIEAAYRVAFWMSTPEDVPLEEIFRVYRPPGHPRVDYEGAQPSPAIPLPPPPPKSVFELQTEALSFESPFDFFGTIPGIVTAAGGTTGILVYIAKNLEDLFDMPGRIRVRRIQRERQRYEELRARDEAKQRYLEARRSPSRRFNLEDGEIERDKNSKN